MRVRSPFVATAYPNVTSSNLNSLLLSSLPYHITRKYHVLQGVGDRIQGKDIYRP